MGLFVADHGHSQGWLAALLCCWTAPDDDDHSLQTQFSASPSAPNHLSYTQPTPLPPIRLQSSDSAIVDPSLPPLSERPPSIKPLDLGSNSPLLATMSWHTRSKTSTALPQRITISSPTAFRRLEYTDPQRRSLIPLQLDPVVLRKQASDPILGERISPAPAALIHDTDSSYRACRGTPFQRCQKLSSLVKSDDHALGVNEKGAIILDSKLHILARPPLLATSSDSALPLRQDTSDLAPTSTSRPASEGARLKRKRTDQKHSPYSADLNVDREILELNAIVEERRAESALPHNSYLCHVPAVAPSMSVRARSETLNDIGSVFSRPLLSVTTSVPQPDQGASPAAASTFSSGTPSKSRLSRPFEPLPDLGVAQSGPSPVRQRPSSRITGWLSSLLSSSSTPGASISSLVEMSPDHHRQVSGASLYTSNTNLASPAQTDASSPVSKSHTRSLTAESRMTPLSPPSTVDGFPAIDLSKSSEEEPSHDAEQPRSQVGLAL